MNLFIYSIHFSSWSQPPLLPSLLHLHVILLQHTLPFSLENGRSTNGYKPTLACEVSPEPGSPSPTEATRQPSLGKWIQMEARVRLLFTWRFYTESKLYRGSSERVHPVTDENRCRNPQPSIRWSLERLLGEWEEWLGELDGSRTLQHQLTWANGGWIINQRACVEWTPYSKP